MSKQQIGLKNNMLASYSATLSIIEIGLGGFLHAFKLPLSGQILSLNQIFILSHASIKIPHQATPATISMISALLKSLAPAGKKLTPMLAIACQGHLFSLGLWMGGVNFLGRCMGATLSALWAYIQPLMLYLLLFGEEIIYIYNYFFKKLSSFLSITHDNFLLILSSLILLKILISLSLVILSYRINDKQIEKIANWAKKYQKPAKATNTSNLHPLLGALKDLVNPLFLLSLLLTLIFFYFADSSYSTLIWSMLRPIGIGYLIFFLLRILPIENIFEDKKNGKYQELLKLTLKKIRS